MIPADTERTSSSKAADSPFYFIVVVWGEEFRTHFLRFCLASLLSSGNIPALDIARRSKFLLATRPEDWEAMRKVTTNLMGAYLVAKYALPLMRPKSRPRILILSGGGAFDPMPHVSAYGVSKAATVRLVETLAVELKPRNIAVNAIAPGFAPTEIHEATVAAGRERAGEHFDKTEKLMLNWDNSMDVPIECVRYMVSERSAKLTGKTISARYDPWGEPEFDEHIDQIVATASSATYHD